MIRANSAFAVLCAMFLPQGATACETLLTIVAGGETHTYDRDELMALEAAEFTTSTPWTTGPQHFQGVLLADVLEDAGISDGTIRATALNEYAMDLEVGDIQPDAEGYGPMIAYLVNGAEMSVRERGPLWLVWPYDAAPRFATEVIFSSSIWQLDSIRQVAARN